MGMLLSEAECSAPKTGRHDQFPFRKIVFQLFRIVNFLLQEAQRFHRKDLVRIWRERIDADNCGRGPKGIFADTSPEYGPRNCTALAERQSTKVRVSSGMHA